MKNEIIKTNFAIRIDTTRGQIIIEADALGDNSVGYHYKPIDKGDPYMNGPLTVNPTGTTDHDQIREYLKRSWIEPTSDVVQQIEDAACLVQALAKNHKVGDTNVVMTSEEFGNERYGPHNTLNDSLASVSRLFHSAVEQGDGVQRTIGVVVNDEEDWRDDDDEVSDMYDEIGGEG